MRIFFTCIQNLSERHGQMHKTFFRRSDIQRLVVPPTPVKPYFHLQIGRLGLHIVKLLRNVYYEQIARVRQ